MAAIHAPARPAAPGQPWRRVGWIAVAVLVAAAAATAGLTGWPQRTGEAPADEPPADNPLAINPLAAPAARYAALEHQIAKYPRDNRARVLKARMDLQAGRYELAAAGYRAALAAAPKVARDAGVWVELAEAQALRQGGTLAGEPRELIRRALGIQADHPQALELAGSAAYEAREFSAAARYWQRLIAQIPASDPRHGELAAAIARADKRGRLSLPEAR